MKKIVIFNCGMSAARCTGSGCFRAFNGREAFFARYQEEPVEMVAFTRCNGCGRDWENDERLARKLERIKALGTDVVHFGACTVKEGKECGFITRLGAKLESEGMEVVRGTHKTH